MAAGCAARAALFSWRFIIPLIFFVFCYWKIISVLRGNKVGTVSAGNATRSIRVSSRQQHTAGPSTSTAAAAAASAAGSRSKPTNKSQRNVITTMIAVTSCFIVCWLPFQFAIVAGMCGLRSWQNSAKLFGALGVIASVSNSVNPFIYATGLNESIRIKCAILLHRLTCKENPHVISTG